MKTQNIGILGHGEVGQAIAKFYKNPKVKDLSKDDGLIGVDILHVCIPFTKNFIKTIKQEIKKIKPKIIIIHSTVPIGTTKKIGGSIVHSPIRGIHPHLYKGVKTFIKYIGADNKKVGKIAENHLKSLGIKTKLLNSSATSEALKLWDTTQYGWMIVLNKEIKKWCDKNGVDFEAVYTQANKTYNEGYRKFGKPEVARPYLNYVKGKIGGHCVTQNCRLLDSMISKIILEKNDNY